MQTRNFKYANRSFIIPLIARTPFYFQSWLSGFIEAKSSFAKRSGSVGFSFSISLANDIYLIQIIRDYFNQSQLTVQTKNSANNNPIYFIEIANIKAIDSIVKHCIKYPLLGYKYYQLASVMKNSVALSHIRYNFVCPLLKLLIYIYYFIYLN
jgi:hypothetical protein